MQRQRLLEMCTIKFSILHIIVALFVYAGVLRWIWWAERDTSNTFCVLRKGKLFGGVG
jgi:hypothetical protein